MKTKLVAVAVFALTVFAGGCASTCPGFAPEQSIPVEIRSTTPVTVLIALAVRKDDQVLVSGTLRRPATVPLPGHLDVLFLDPDGSPFHEHRIEVAGLGSKRGGVHEISFSATVNLDLPAGSRAVLSYHAQPL